jgi:hypothetical protein
MERMVQMGQMERMVQMGQMERMVQMKPTPRRKSSSQPVGFD